jgi:hypothetical protein
MPRRGSSLGRGPSASGMINPSTAKAVYSAKFGDFWSGLAYAGQASSRMTIIGYSLPQHDDYARQVVHRREQLVCFGSPRSG